MRSIIFCVAFLLCIASSARPDEKPIFTEDFETGSIGNFGPYGEGTNIEITKETEFGKYALEATFDDKSSVAWCNKGVSIQFEKGMSWDDFNYIYFNYKIKPGTQFIGCYIFDEAGNYWHTTQSQGLVSDKWGFNGTKKDFFQFSYNSTDSKIKNAKKESKISGIIIYFSTLEVNTGTKYTVFLDNVTFSKSFPLP